MSLHKVLLRLLLVASLGLLAFIPVRAQFIQQGSKLVGDGHVGNTTQGYSVALSADGNTAIIGGPNDSHPAGAIWVFTRVSDTWSQQGSKIGISGAGLGVSVALSADGNTALVGGPRDNSSAGAAFVFTRTNGTWSLQGNKLAGADAVGGAYQGQSVALSADGNTAIVGGPYDNSSTGAAFVFTRTNGTWNPQGGKLVGDGPVGSAHQGFSVALSADGNTALVGGPADNSWIGAAFVFTRTNGTWSQQGGKLVGGDVVGQYPEQGYSVALSADGNTAIVGGPWDNSSRGAAFVFTRSGGVWSQQGTKLVGIGAADPALQGYSVSLSSDGYMAIVGGYADNGGAGAAWVFTRSGEEWSQQGMKLVGGGAVGPANQGSSVSLSSDGNTAIVGGSSDNSSVGAVWVFVQSAAARVTLAVDSPTLLSFNTLYDTTAVSVNLTQVTGTGSITAARYSSPPLSPQFVSAPPNHVSVYRWVIQQSGLTGIVAEVRFAIDQIPQAGIIDPLGVTVFNRPTEGTGTFTALSTSFDEPSRQLRVNVTGFSEFIFGSNDSPLPVQLTGFTGNVLGNGLVQLVWATKTEVNNFGFYVQRRFANETIFADIHGAFIPGHGTTNVSQQYSYTDSLSLAGQYEYRLKQVDLDGTVHYPEPIRIELGKSNLAEEKPKEFSLSQNYPNPFNPTTVVKYALPVKAHVSLVVYNTLGQIVSILTEGEMDPGYYDVKFNGTDLSSGVYLYRLRAGDFVQTRKLLLLR
jgi:hypothetical protein